MNEAWTLKFYANWLKEANLMASPTKETEIVKIIKSMESLAEKLEGIENGIFTDTLPISMSKEWMDYERQIAENTDRPNGGVLL